MVLPSTTKFNLKKESKCQGITFTKPATALTVRNPWLQFDQSELLFSLENRSKALNYKS